MIVNDYLYVKFPPGCRIWAIQMFWHNCNGFWCVAVPKNKNPIIRTYTSTRNYWILIMVMRMMKSIHRPDRHQHPPMMSPSKWFSVYFIEQNLTFFLFSTTVYWQIQRFYDSYKHCNNLYRLAAKLAKWMWIKYGNCRKWNSKKTSLINI